jgi:hypothetical protein
MDTVLTLWEACDRVAWLVEQKAATESKGLAALGVLDARIDAALLEVRNARQAN